MGGAPSIILGGSQAEWQRSCLPRGNVPDVEDLRLDQGRALEVRCSSHVKHTEETVQLARRLFCSSL